MRKAGLEIHSPDDAELFFILHTCFALLVKLLAWLALLGHLGVRGAPSFVGLATADGDTLRRCPEMESAGIFRAYGITNPLEVDFFEWYSHAWSDNIKESIQEIIRRLEECDPTRLTLVPEEMRACSRNSFATPCRGRAATTWADTILPTGLPVGCSFRFTTSSSSAARPSASP